MSKRKLLLADDSITIQKVVNLTFADEGIEVISVGDGDSAMRKFEEFMPDLVMADVNMPGLNGYEVCRIIKVTEETRHIPVILLVGSFEPFDEAEAREAGADDFLTKPFQSIRQLVNKVTDLLNRGDGASEETTAAAAPVVDSFAETLEFNKFEEPDTESAPPASLTQEEQETPRETQQQEAPRDFENRQDYSYSAEARPTEISSEFGDAGMDDEMIEASPATEYVSGSDAVYQGETTIDYAKTQPLNAEDLKGFEMVSGGNAEQPQAAELYEIQQPITESREQPEERSEPASFDEEARKLDQTEDFETPRREEEYEAPRREEASETPRGEDEYPAPASNEEPDNLAETEPQLDYYLPNEPEFEKELSDADTLEPEVSYENEPPREADFSQATETESDESENETVAANEPAETATAAFEGDESGAFDETEDESGAAPENRAENVSETSAASFVEQPQLSEQTAGFGSWEHPVSYSETETEKTEKAEETPTAPPETEIEKPEEATAAAPEGEEPEGEETETVEADETAEAAETIEETPISASDNAPALDFDDADLLELPPLVEETGIRPQPKAEALVPEVVASPAVAEPESKITVTKTVAESEIALSFPPDLIEAIAQAVAEKISAKTMTDILPQITELVMKKLAEENQEGKK